MKYKLDVNVNHFDKFGYKLFGYPALLSHLGYLHLKDSDQSFGVMLENRYAWVIISMKLHFNKRIDEPINFDGYTWYAGRKGPYFRREYEILSDTHKIIGSSYSILFDFETDSIYRKREFPFSILEEKEKFLLDLSPSFKENIDLKEIGRQIVKNSHIDGLGHTNHLKYLEFIYDALSEDQIIEVYKYNTLELFFQNEMLLGDEFSINIGHLNNKTVFQIYNITKYKISFTLVCSNE